MGLEDKTNLNLIRDLYQMLLQNWNRYFILIDNVVFNKTNEIQWKCCETVKWIICTFFNSIIVHFWAILFWLCVLMVVINSIFTYEKIVLKRCKYFIKLVMITRQLLRTGFSVRNSQLMLIYEKQNSNLLHLELAF